MINLKNSLVVGIIALFLATASCSFTNGPTEVDPKDEGKLTNLVALVLLRNHFNPAELDDDFSEELFENFIEDMDPAKRYFLASDYKDFEKYRLRLDEEIQESQANFFDVVYKRLQKRQKQTESLTTEILEEGFDFSTNESIETDYSKIAFAKSETELRNHLRKMLKLTTLSFYADLKLEQEQNDSIESPKSDEELQQEALKSIKKSTMENFDLLEDVERKDYFSIYLNAMTSIFDPHTNYFAPRNKERFDQSMSGKLEGIGARLQKTMDDIKIVEVLTGGPAWKSEELEVGDKIIKVAQEGDSIPTSIVGMRISDAVELIKGPKGTKVYLTVKKVDGTIQQVVLERDVVLIEETFAKSAIINRNGKRYGMINLPKFYFDFNDREGRAAGDDIAKELESLQKEGIDGLVFDLRNNGGGSLREVIEMAGLFIDRGPVVQVAGKNGKHQAYDDRNPGTLYDGPMVIMVNEFSASASEILAAALQDYERAIVIGSDQTFGKGTVQYLENLNDWVRNSDMGELGAVKLTSQKFYRVNGGSTQLKGVVSDVALPSRYSYISIGERDEEHPLPYDEIEPAEIDKFTGYQNYAEAIDNSKARVKQDEEFSLISEQARWLKQQRDESTVPLAFEDYKQYLDDLEQRSERFDSIGDVKTGLEVSATQSELPRIKVDSSLAEKRERWFKNLKQDLYLEEAVNILDDLKMNNEKLTRTADGGE